MPDDLPLIHARGLVKRFGDFTAVDGIDVDVERGEAFGFLGPNGAGKSSTMRMIGAVSPVTEGTLRVLGHDPEVEGAEIRARLGVVPQEDTLDFELTVRENLLTYGRYFGLSRKVVAERADRLLEFVQLTERGGSKAEQLSGGMKRRLTIARSLLNEPELLLLDEPTTGLDPQARHVVWDRLFRLKQQGVTLVLTTHYMDEAEQLCDRLIVVDKGRIMAEGTPASLIRDHSSREVLEVRFGASHNAQAATRLQGIGDRVEVLPDRILIYAHNGEAALEAVTARGLQPLTSLVRRSSLEDVFLRLTPVAPGDQIAAVRLWPADQRRLAAQATLHSRVHQNEGGDEQRAELEPAAGHPVEPHLQGWEDRREVALHQAGAHHPGEEPGDDDADSGGHRPTLGDVTFRYAV